MADLADIGPVLASIMHHTPLPVWVVDPDGTVLYANPAAAVDLLGYADAEDVVGRPSHDVLHPRHPDGTVFPAADCRMLEPLVTGLSLHGQEEWFVRADGSWLPVSWSAAPIALPAGRGVIHSFVDLTERFQLEQETRERERAEFRRAETKEAHLRLMSEVAAARREIVADLHDGAQQRLVGVTLQARLLQESLGTTGGDTAALLTELIDNAQSAIGELRELVVGIHPPILTSRGLTAAVRARAAGCPVPVVVDGNLAGTRLPALIESNGYFFVTEALTNAVKHSRATRVDITLTVGDGLLIQVIDNGVGGAGGPTTGSGLQGMRDRVQAFDGTMEMDSPVGGGTTIRAVIPMSGHASR